MSQQDKNCDKFVRDIISWQFCDDKKCYFSAGVLANGSINDILWRLVQFVLASARLLYILSNKTLLDRCVNINYL